MRYDNTRISYTNYDLDNSNKSTVDLVIPTRYTNPLFNYSVFSVGLYTTEFSDTYQSIASKLYNDASQWWKIADLNPEYDPLDYLDALPDNITLKVIITE
jgi:nucleoid-associated protein YgaU